MNEEVTSFYDSITKHKDPRIGCPLPIFTVENESRRHFVAIKKDSVDLRTFLADTNKMELFYHQLSTAGGEYKVRVSGNYRKLISYRF